MILEFCITKSVMVSGVASLFFSSGPFALLYGGSCERSLDVTLARNGLVEVI